jgi:polysaccharide export outer membrane protein
MIAMLASCSSLGGGGPSSRDIKSAGNSSVANADIKIIDVNDAVARQVLAANRAASFSESLGDAPRIGTMIGRGDVLEVTIWESPPAALFGGQASFGPSETGAILAASSGSTQRTALPEMMVDSGGDIRIPFAGTISAAGRTPRQIEREIINRLSRKAHDPQVIVRLVRNANANVTVVGDVASNTRVTLTPRGERLLDVLATAGGVTQAVNKMTIQITRGGQVASLPLERVIKDPAQNIRLGQDDIVTALYQPFSFTSLGATGNNAEVPFEATGITLAQALGRVGGVNSERANIRGVFIFRLENPVALDPVTSASARRTPDGLVPVIYRIDLKNPATFFVAQGFPIRDKDVLYVSSAPLTDLQRFVGIVSSMAFTVIGLGQAVP